MASGQSFTLSIKALFDTSDVRAKVEGIQNILNNIKLPDNLKRSFDSSFININKALDEFNSRVEKGIKSKADATGISKSFDNIIKELNTLDKLMANVKNQLGDGVDLSKIIKIDDSTRNKVNQLSQEIANLQKEISKITTDNLDKLQQALQNIKSPAAKKGAQSALGLFEEGKIQESLKLLDQVIVKQQQVQNALTAKGTSTANVDANIKWLTQMRDEIKNNVLPLVENYNSQIGEKATQAANLLNDSQQRTAQGARDLANGLRQVTLGASGVAPRIHELVGAQAQFIREIDQVKSRIQYFFGLSNGINLVKRAIRGAVQTIKDLDKAMTATAVVTDFTVSDMWKQLPEYTKRANQLGVTTQAAYEAATLYYQQGLNTEEVNALSVETLKMARIGGLDAAEATDRMTNALRGFNMELNTQSAQRVDDVYSELAANTASNVDEISTAMTKVASLAHSANMEFETTAAFLAQIIETTRESPETAGTALKTVVARFAEVKKLVDEDQLKGQDEEGQVVDVNKVSAALRTAGIDLNKYFLGEVGLDDIFMELASKWNSLTSIQQRYIATQAAGSRQQSRFIALMQDYSRTQELVGKAYNSEGASAKQFEKTQESLESKLARLKNAWKEFLMGLTNSTMVKGFVDILTKILNLVNKITGAFGSGVGSVLKWVTAFGVIGGLRRLFVDGGIATRAIAGLMGNSPMATRFRVNAGLGVIDQATQQYQAFTPQQLHANRGTPLLFTPWQGIWQGIQQFKANSLNPLVPQNLWKSDSAYLQARQAYQAAPTEENLRRVGQARLNARRANTLVATPTTLFGALGNRFIGTKIGGKISTILGAGLGKIGIGTGAALGGAATLATTLGGIAAAAGIAYIAIKKIYDASPEGQLKKAEKYAEAISEIADNAKKAASEMRDVQQKTSDYETQIREATSSGDREKAIQDQNEYILSLLKKNATYAQYIQSSFTSGGQLYLTIDPDAFAAAIDKISEGANKANAFNQFGQAIVAQQRADLYRNRLSQSQVYTIPGARGTPAEQDIIAAGVKRLQENDTYRNFQYQSQIDAANLAMQQYTKIATSQLIDTFDLNINNAEQELISSAIAKNFNADNLQVQADEIKKTLNDAAFLESEYFRLFGVELEKGYDKEQAKLSVALGKAVEESIGKEIPDLANIVTDSNSKLLLEVLAGSYEGAPQEIEAAIRGLTEEQKQIFADFLKVDAENIQQTLQNRYQDLLKDQEAFREESVNTLAKAGVTNIKLLDSASKKLKVSQLKQLTNFANQWSDYGKEFNNELLSKTTLAMLNGGTHGRLFEDFASGITDNPVLTLQHIKQSAENAYPAIQSVAKSLLEISEPQFSQKNQLQYFLTSGEYENLGEQISKLIEANGEINGYNIEELANSSETLSAMLDMGTMSANGLANAINALEAGNITILDLNEKVIELYESFDTTARTIERASYFIANFNPGKDYSEAINFVEDLAEKMQNFLDKGYLGNLEGYGKAMFANPPDPEDIEGWQNAITMLQQAAGNGGLDFWSNFVGFNVDENGFMDMDLTGFAESGITNYVDYIKDRAAKKLPEGFNFSDAFYDLMLENARLHDAGAFEDIAAIELGKMMDAYGQATPTQADIQSIADAYGLEPQAVLDAWAQRWGKEPLDFSQLQNKVRESYTSIADLADQAFFDAIRNGVSRPEAADNSQDTSWILKQLGMGPEGSFSINQLRLKIDQIVPEVADGSMSADDWLSQEVFKNGPVKLPVEFTATKKVGDEWVTDTFKTDVLVSSLEEYQAAAEQIQSQIQQQNIFEDSQTYASNLVTTLQQLNDISGVGTIKADIEAAGALADDLQGKLQEEVNKTVNINPSTSQITVSGGEGTITLSIGVAANGGYVASAAQGGNILSPGLALTGEEAPEIIWNKNKGYAYLTGKNGPEIQNLQPGDRIFDGSQTKDILKRSKIGSFDKTTPPPPSKKAEYINNSAANGLYDGTTYWNDGKKSGSNEGGSNSSKSSDDKWKNTLDWLYDLMEDIAEEEHKQTLIQSEYELAEKDLTKTGRDLFNLTKAELETLNTQLEAQQFAFEKRLQQMNELQQKVVAEGFEEYLRWDPEDNSLEIDWDKINEITDKDTYDKLSELVSDMEEVQDQMDEAQEATLDIKKQIQELQTRYLQAYLDFQDKVMEAVVAQYQQNIDSLSELNDTINDANQSILDSIQKEIDLQRQIRDNTDTEKEIADIEARLVMLQRDTTGANQQEILELQKQLDETRENYSDTLVDQAIDRLSQNNDDAQEQREKQIELLEAQLEYWQETGALWEEVANLIATGFTPQGSIIEGSTLWEFLKDKDSWRGLSQAQKDNWANELILESAQVGAYLIQLNDGTEVSTDRIIDSIIGEHGLAEEITAETRIVRAQLNQLIATLGGTPIDSIPGEEGYASGGLATKTGLAMLHGTANEPEYVLNARQTGAFLRLADVLPSIFSSDTGATNNYGTNVYVELNMSVGEIGSDYDVDRLVARVKDDIYDASSYRNVNAVSFLR